MNIRTKKVQTRRNGIWDEKEVEEIGSKNHNI
jgi:hypothetical protein